MRSRNDWLWPQRTKMGKMVCASIWAIRLRGSRPASLRASGRRDSLLPVDEIFDQILGAFNAGFPYVAVALSLSLPDICANLRAPPEASSDNQKKRFIRWFDEYLAAEMDPITGADFYSLRCGIVHRGQFGVKGSYDVVMFSLPVKGVFMNMAMTNMNGTTSLQVDAAWFCKTVVAAADRWFKTAGAYHVVAKNADGLVRFRPNGFSPFLVGIPCIA